MKGGFGRREGIIQTAIPGYRQVTKVGGGAEKG